MPLMVTESGRDDAWMAAAMEAAGIAKSERVGVWIGGLAMPFAEIYSPPLRSWGERFLPTAFDEQLAAAAQMQSSISFCADHSCSVATGLIGRTAKRTGEAQTRYWVEKEDGDLGPAGLYVIGRAAEFAGSPAAVIAEQIERGSVDGLSVSGWSLQENNIFDNDDYSVLYEVARFKLIETSAVARPAFSNTFIKAGRFSDMDEDKRTTNGSSMVKALPKLPEWQSSVVRAGQIIDPGSAAPDTLGEEQPVRGRYREFCTCQQHADIPGPTLTPQFHADAATSSMAEMVEGIKSLQADIQHLTAKLSRMIIANEIAERQVSVGVDFSEAAKVEMPSDMGEKPKTFIPFPV